MQKWELLEKNYVLSNCFEHKKYATEVKTEWSSEDSFKDEDQKFLTINNLKIEFDKFAEFKDFEDIKLKLKKIKDGESDTDKNIKSF